MKHIEQAAHCTSRPFENLVFSLNDCFSESNGNRFFFFLWLCKRFLAQLGFELHSLSRSAPNHPTSSYKQAWLLFHTVSVSVPSFSFPPAGQLFLCVFVVLFLVSIAFGSQHHNFLSNSCFSCSPSQPLLPAPWHRRAKQRRFSLLATRKLVRRGAARPASARSGPPPPRPGADTQRQVRAGGGRAGGRAWRPAPGVACPAVVRAAAPCQPATPPPLRRGGTRGRRRAAGRRGSDTDTGPCPPGTAARPAAPRGWPSGPHGAQPRGHGGGGAAFGHAPLGARCCTPVSAALRLFRFTFSSLSAFTFSTYTFGASPNRTPRTLGC